MRLGFVLVVLAALPNLSVASPPPHVLHVDVGDPRAVLGGTCSPQEPCRRISDALARARALRAEGWTRPLKIVIARGLYEGVYGTPGGEKEDLPLLVNVPDLTLRGETVLPVDEKERPLLMMDGNDPTFLDPNDNTVIRAPSTSASTGVILVLPTRDLVTRAHTVGDRAVIEGLSVDASGSGAGIMIDRAAGVVVRGNGVYGVYTQTINTGASFKGNLLMNRQGTALNIAVADRDRPHEVIVRDNRMVQNLAGGIYVGATGFRMALDLGVHAARYSFGLPTLHDHHFGKVLIENNDISGHTRNVNLGFAVRLVACDIDQGTAPEVAGELEVTIKDNDFIDNIVGVAVDGGWPRRVQPGPFEGVISATLSGNQITARRFEGLASLGRFGTAGTNTVNNFKYIERSTFTIDDPEGNLGRLAIDHMAVDPLSGTVLGNTLWINGISIPAPTRSCSLPSLSSFPYPPATACVP